MMISIHTPTKGATENITTSAGGAGISIHTPTKGATGKNDNRNRTGKFQSTLPQRERPGYSVLVNV